MTTRNAADLHAVNVKLADRRAALAEAQSDEDQHWQLEQLRFEIEMLEQNAARLQAA